MTIRSILSRFYLLLFVILMIVLLGLAQVAKARKVTFQVPKLTRSDIDMGLAAINSGEIKDIIYKLSAPELEGRRMGTHGGLMAGDFVSEKLGFYLGDLEAASVLWQNFQASGREPIKRSSRNVMGVVGGTSKNQEYVFIISHYDHIGLEKGIVCPGANDNASGVAAVLEVAKAYSLLAKNKKRPMRSMVFLFTDGEEMGFLGAAYFVKHSPFLLDKIAAVINLESVGRNDPSGIFMVGTPYFEDMRSKNPDIYKAATRSAAELGLKILPDKNELAGSGDPDHGESLFQTSDHDPFFYPSFYGVKSSRRIPTVMFYSGDFSEYHTPGDIPALVNFKKVESVARLAFLTSWRLANSTAMPVYRD